MPRMDEPDGAPVFLGGVREEKRNTVLILMTLIKQDSRDEIDEDGEVDEDDAAYDTYADEHG